MNGRNSDAPGRDAEMDTGPMREDIRRQFEEVAARADDDVRLDEAALLIAAETDEPFDPEDSLQALDALAERFERVFDSTTTLGVSVSSLVDFLHREEGFTGNVKNYYAPENSYLNRVISSRYGIPITLALVHLAVGQRLDLPVSGINFPGHFLVRYGEDKPLYVDPFSGRFLSETDCATLLRQIAGRRARMEPHHLQPAPNKVILVRVLDNLKQLFWRNKAWEESELCIERQLLLLPEQDEYSIQLGAVYEMQGRTVLARHTYTTLLQGSDDDQIRNMASQRLLALEATSPTIH